MSTCLNIEKVAGNPVSRFINYCKKLSTEVLFDTTSEDMNFIHNFQIRREVRIFEYFWIQLKIFAILFLILSIPQIIQEGLIHGILAGWENQVFYYFVFVASWMHAFLAKSLKKLIAVELAHRLYGLRCNVPIFCQH